MILLRDEQFSTKMEYCIMPSNKINDDDDDDDDNKWREDNM